MTDAVKEPTALEVILTNLDGVTKAIIMRYGLHPEADATEAAAVVIRGLIASAGRPPEPVVVAKAAPTTKTKVA